MPNLFHKHAIAVMSLAVLMICSSCARSSAPVDHGKLTKRPQPKISITSLEKQIHAMINRERKKNGLSQIALNDKLSGISRKHSRDMAKRAYFDHRSPEGHDFLYRYGQDGYKCSISSGGRIYMGAENIALNHLYASVTTVNGEHFYDWNSEEKIADTTVQGWMNSPGHRKNILTPLWNNEGIGISISSDDKVYITQNFC
jgi:uncharacterized protein YkwD